MYLRYLAPQLVLGGVALVLLCCKIMGRFRQTPATTIMATLGLVAAGAALWPLRFDRISFLGGTFVVDSLSLYFEALFLVTALLVTWGAAGWARRNPEVDLEFHALLLLETAALTLMVSAGELISLYLALEASVITFFALSALNGERKGANEATLKFVLIGGLSAAFLLYGMSFLYGFTGTTNLEEIGLRLQATGWPLLRLTVLLLLAGLGFKLAVVPFHFWSPDVYEAAPTPVTAFLGTASKTAALAVALRLFTTALPALAGEWAMAFAIVAAATVIFGNLAAIPQTNVKRLLAYSSIAQSGYLLLGLAAISLPGLIASLFYAGLYTFTNLTAFLVVTAWEDLSGQTDLKGFGGLARRAPFLAGAMLLALLSLAGIPPLAGFIGKFTLFLAVIHQGQLWLAVVAAGMSVVSAYYYLNLARVMYAEPPIPLVAAGGEPAGIAAGTTAGTTLRTVVPATRLAIVLSLLGTVILGIWPVWFLRLADWAVRMFWG